MNSKVKSIMEVVVETAWAFEVSMICGVELA